MRAGPSLFQLMLRRGSQVIAEPGDPGADKGAQPLPLTTDCVERNLLYLSMVECLTGKQRDNIEGKKKNGG